MPTMFYSMARKFCYILGKSILLFYKLWHLNRDEPSVTREAQKKNRQLAVTRVVLWSRPLKIHVIIFYEFTRLSWTLMIRNKKNLYLIFNGFGTPYRHINYAFYLRFSLQSKIQPERSKFGYLYHVYILYSTLRLSEHTKFYCK